MIFINELQIFKNEQFGEIRTTINNGEPLFVAADVCKALDIGNTKMATDRLDNDEKDEVSLTDTIGRNQNMTAITESGLYSLVLGSRKPEAKIFKRWITHDVIPTIRKTGGYVNNEDAFINTYLPYADESTKQMFHATLQTIQSLNRKIDQDKPKVLFADAVDTADTSILVGELAKLIKQNGVNIGQQRLFDWLRINGYLIKRKGADYNMPTQKAMEMKLFQIKERTINNPDGTVRISKTAKVTGKGQQYFINKFLNKEGDTNL